MTMAKDSDYQRLIHTSRWLKLRRSVISTHPLCQRCEKEGYITAATEVHHKVPVETALTYREKEHLMFDRSNLMALCHHCHVRIHFEMGRSGKKVTRERNAKRTKEFNLKFSARADFKTEVTYPWGCFFKRGWVALNPTPAYFKCASKF